MIITSSRSTPSNTSRWIMTTKRAPPPTSCLRRRRTRHAKCCTRRRTTCILVYHRRTKWSQIEVTGKRRLFAYVGSHRARPTRTFWRTCSSPTWFSSWRISGALWECVHAGCSKYLSVYKSQNIRYSHKTFVLSWIISQNIFFTGSLFVVQF